MVWAFVQRFLENKSTEQQVLFHRTPWVNDPQSAFLLFMCGSTRANFWLRALKPADTESFSRRHDENVWTFLRQILGTPNAPGAHTLATLAFSAGGLGGNRSESASCCTLGELGRFPSHGSSASPSCCGTHVSRVADQCSVDVFPISQTVQESCLGCGLVDATMAGAC